MTEEKKGRRQLPSSFYVHKTLFKNVNRGLTYLFVFVSLWNCTPIQKQTLTIPFSQCVEKSVRIPISPPAKCNFTTSVGGYANFGFIDGTVWLRISKDTIPSNAKEQYLVIRAFNIDQIWLFQKQNSESKPIQSGNGIPNRNKDILHTEFVFPISEPTDDIFIAIQSNISLQFQLELATLDSLYEEVFYRHWYYGLFFGIILLIVVYNGTIAFLVWDRNYFYYVAYVLFFGLGQSAILGFWNTFIFPEFPYVKKIAIPLLFSLALGFFALFTARFLQLKKYFPIYHRLFRVIQVCAFGLGIISLLGGVYFSAKAVSILGAFLFLFLAPILVLGWNKRNRSYRYFSFAFLVLLSSIFLYSLSKFGLIPSSLFLEEILLPIASLFDLTLFAFALADRIHLLRLEKDKALNKIHDLQKERKISRDILMQSLPKGIPILERIQIEIFILPMKDVGGDFYDFYSPNAREIGIVLCDVSGHGIPASLISAMGKVSFTTQKDSLYSPKRVLEGMNQVLFENCSPEYITASYVYANTSTGVWRFGRAGHPSAFLQRNDGEILTIHPKGKILGAFPEIQIEEVSYQLHKNDRVLLLSDGVLECFNQKNEMFGEHRLLQFMSETQGLPLSLTKSKLIRELESFSERDRKDWEDDLTFLILDIV